jgi:hypothetical protein
MRLALEPSPDSVSASAISECFTSPRTPTYVEQPYSLESLHRLIEQALRERTPPTPGQERKR